MVRINALKTLNEFCRGTVRNAQKIALTKIKQDEAMEGEMDLDELKDKVAQFKLTSLPLELIAKLIIALRELRPSSSDRQGSGCFKFFCSRSKKCLRNNVSCKVRYKFLQVNANP